MVSVSGAEVLTVDTLSAIGQLIALLALFAAGFVVAWTLLAILFVVGSALYGIYSLIAESIRPHW